MKQKILSLLSITGGSLLMTKGLEARSFLGSVSSVVLIFSILAGASIWAYAIKKRRELDE